MMGENKIQWWAKENTMMGENKIQWWSKIKHNDGRK